jgi:hypothetical protein
MTNEEQTPVLEEQTPVFDEGIPESPATIPADPPEQPTVIVTELILDGRRVIGELRLPGSSRRLVDILNAQDGYLTLHNGTLTEDSGRSLHFDTMQLTRRSIVVALPHEGSSARMDPVEVIEKARRLVTVILPGSELSGYFHVVAGVDPSAATSSVGDRFLVLTDVTITLANSDVPTRFEPVALLNAVHVQAYVWSDEAAQRDPRHAHSVAIPVEQTAESAAVPLA